MAIVIFANNETDKYGSYIAFCNSQSDIDNGVNVKNDDYITIDLSDDEYTKMKQNKLTPISYDASNNITWNDRDAAVAGAPDFTYTEADYTTQKQDVLDTYNAFKEAHPSYYNMDALNSAIATAESIDPAAIGGTSDQFIWYFMWEADNNFLAPTELV